MLAVSIIALIVSALALIASAASVVYTRRQAHAAEGAAAFSREEDRRARTPELEVMVETTAAHDGDRAIYSVRNDGPQDLESVIVCRPRPSDGITYSVATTGVTDWQDEAEVGPLALTEAGRFTLSLGSGIDLPEFRVQIVCRAGGDEWKLTRRLEYPRQSPPPVVSFGAR